MLYFIDNGCPNCKGMVSDERLGKGLPCVSCLPEEKIPANPSITSICKTLDQEKTLKYLKIFGEVEKKVTKFKKLFKEIIEAEPSSLQINWAKRFFLGESFAIIAPTGTGKSTFGLLGALLTSKKALIIVPTKMLVNQVETKINEFLDKTSSSALKKKRILAYTGNKKEKELLEKQNFDVFICTSAFMHKNFEVLKKIDFSLIFVDDVDSFLKSSKNVDNLFLLLGFSEEEIRLALKREKTEDDYSELLKIKQNHRNHQKQLIISSATLRPRTNRVFLFQNLLGFEITRFISTLRKVVDTCLDLGEPRDIHRLSEEAIKLAKALGKGGLIFIEESYGRAYVEKFTEELRKMGVKAISYLETSEEELLTKLKQGEVEVAVGLCHLGNPLVRGLDLPEILRYAIFLGVPKHVFPLSTSGETFSLSATPQFLHSLLLSLMPLFKDEERITAISYVNYLKRFLTLKEEDLPKYEGLYKKVLSIKGFLEEKLQNPEFIEKLKTSEEVFLERDEKGGYNLIVGNASSYLQASGRVSRLTTKGLMPGISVILVDSLKALNSLKKRLKFYLSEELEIKEVSFKQIIELDIKIKEERKKISAEKIDFKNYLLIVESPHKAKTIANFFGKPSVRRYNNLWIYEIPMENTLLSVCASLGHIYNLSRKKGIFGVLKDNGNFYPVFNTIKIDREKGEQYIDDEEIKEKENLFDKGEIIEGLRVLSFCSDQTFIASDPDSEGEKIAYDLYINLKPFQKNIKRLEFHEVTVRALKQALSAPQEINLPRVKAQLARRLADRWVGFSLSQELWKVFQKNYLSAGRVQTPVLGWVIEREKLSKQYKYRVNFTINQHPFSIEVEDKSEAEKIEKHLPQAKISLVGQKEDEFSPPPPYTTDTILEEAYHFFKFSTSYTMSLLQELFELGLITYHRTDSTRISEVGRFQVAKPYISERFGEELFSPREWFSEGAHEGIRPTRPWDVEELKLRVAHGLLSFKKYKDSFRIYDLIFRRFLASQMRKTKVLKKTLKLNLPFFTWEEEVIVEILLNGYDLIWIKPQLFPVSSSLKIENISLTKIPKAFLFNQGSLIQEMKKRGLGRPSTYAEIVSTLLNKYYVYELKTGGLVPTSLGKQVYEYLSSRFNAYVSEEFTRELETFMDQVEEGKKEWVEICYTLLPLLKELNIIS
ncbi:reverse gyrase [Thermodesulfobacterium sp. TA1]|uniref:reverse gyrase n=1 Tax=Thermodesulfobacterium sp. TA1 TaxID=2234087 RepID=UPI001232C719|nr:reverse gyrase [Thermodesulfobacterium sp. TA1]QER42880.1 reverse gyrase [Thermodesulfobacterium sp. TA1]